MGILNSVAASLFLAAGCATPQNKIDATRLQTADKVDTSTSPTEPQKPELPQPDPINYNFQIPKDQWGLYVIPSPRSSSDPGRSFPYVTSSQIQMVMHWFMDTWSEGDVQYHRIDNKEGIIKTVQTCRARLGDFPGNATIQPAHIHRVHTMSFTIKNEMAELHGMQPGEQDVIIVTDEQQRVIGYVGSKLFQEGLFYIKNKQGEALWRTPDGRVY